MLICDSSTAFTMYKTKLFVILIFIMLVFIGQLITIIFKVIPKFESRILIDISTIIFSLYMLYIISKSYRDGKRKIIGNISCGDIIQLVKYIDAIVNNPSTLSPKSSHLNIKAVEKTLNELISISPNIAIPIKSILDDTGILAKTKKLYNLHRKITIVALIMPIILIAYLFYVLIFLLEDFGAEYIQQQIFYMNIFLCLLLILGPFILLMPYWYEKRKIRFFPKSLILVLTGLIS